jgi:hypothetical protein
MQQRKQQSLIWPRYFLLWNLNVHYRVHKSQSLYTLVNVHFNIILLSELTLSHEVSSLQILQLTCMHSYCSHACSMHRPSHSTFGHSDHVWWRVATNYAAPHCVIFSVPTYVIPGVPPVAQSLSQLPLNLQVRYYRPVGKGTFIPPYVHPCAKVTSVLKLYAPEKGIT